MKTSSRQPERLFCERDEAEVYPSALVYGCGCWSFAFVTLLLVWGLS